MSDYAKQMQIQAQLAAQEKQQALKAAQGSYSGIANERLQNIARGDTFNPWLAMKQAAVNQFMLAPAESAIYTGAATGAPTSTRDARWEQAVKQAQALQGTSKVPKTFIP